ncbi:MAG: hypothetical protein OXP69_24045 [Spirochaetaceae bacterium]|nr:hypothetical protein [Spirochaetaceae bacterium]
MSVGSVLIGQESHQETALLDELEHRHRAAAVGERLERHLDLATDYELIDAGVGSYAFSPVNAIPRTKYF